MKNALVPFDGSAHALRAMGHALGELRQHPGAQVQLLNVQPHMVEPWPGKLVSPDMVNAELRSRGSKILAQAHAMAQAAGVPCVQHVSIGLAAEEIAVYAAEHGCDAIVMGTRGKGALADLVLGSVAHKLVHLAPVPVTLVK